MSEIARHLGITVIRVSTFHTSGPHDRWQFQPSLPDESYVYGIMDWPNWCPLRRCTLPEYVPDVSGGRAAPVQLSPWKIKAIKLLILLERTGAVTRADMKALEISSSRWTDHWHGFLVPGEGGYTRCSRTPDLRRQHPENWRQIAADFPTWGPKIRPGVDCAAVPMRRRRRVTQPSLDVADA